MKKIHLLLLAAIVLIAACNTKNQKKENEMEKQFVSFAEKHQKQIEPLYKQLTEAYFKASITGNSEDFQKAAELELEFVKIYTNKDEFEQLKKYKESGEIKDSLMLQELNTLYNSYLANQADPKMLQEMINLATGIEEKYNKFRAVVNGKQKSDNEIEEILSTSTNSKEVEIAWTEVKKLGPVVSEDIIALVKMRNQLAQSLGFKNYHEMSLKLSDQDPEEISKIFNELDELTRDAFTELKSEIDIYLAKKFNIKPEDLKPWHYQNRFFQEAPKMYEVDLDKYYTDQNIEKLTIDYYSSIGLDITDMIAKSDLYEKPGKNQHAYCTSIDKNGDVRVLCNIKPNYNWMNTMLHEFGHAVYDKYIDRELPFVLRDAAHTFTTEAIAMLFGRMASNATWMKDMNIIDEAEKNAISETGFRSLRLEQLVFSRWAQVMYNFEKSMYENPDQDLNKLWWDMVEKYQMLNRPEGRDMPDWATKTHIASSPCYYHNYLLGELLASQLNYYICTQILKTDDFNHQSFAGNEEVGKFLTEKVFMPGARYHWNEMIEKATGEKLTAKYYAMQFIDK
ncbi:MAG: M2 family metallopeptidase [Bacteroidales bacterium]|nr:M2 family metallopeptidase [Bacteroidales bacterium]HOY38946.1 M2 family metallopeptidase [Bacteroidales bacterium]HQP03619.1 M2 family metallopeptidase [Bacteroidales bacterium]